MNADAILLRKQDLDISDAGAVAAAFVRHRPDVVVHAAAWTDVDGAEADPDVAKAINAGGTRAIARAAVRTNTLLVYISTDYVFAGDRMEPYREEDPRQPLSIYGASKLAGERITARLKSHLIVRTSWLYGDESGFPATIIRTIRERGAVDVVDDQVK